MIKGILDCGFEFELDSAILNDMRFFDLLSEMDDNPLLFPKVITMLLGKEQKERLYKHLEDENGHISVEDFAVILTEIFEKAGPIGKN